MQKDVKINIQYYYENKEIVVLKGENFTFEDLNKRIKEEFSSFDLENKITINYFKKDENQYSEIKNNEDLKDFIEKAPKKHLTLINEQFEKKFLDENQELIIEIDKIEKDIEPEINNIKHNILENGQELLINIEASSKFLPDLLEKEIDKYVYDSFKNIFKCDLNEDKTESFEKLKDKKKCDLCELYINDEYYFKSNTNKYICKYCESRYRENNYHDNDSVYFLIRQNKENNLCDVESEKKNKILDKMDYSEELKERAYARRSEDLMVNEYDKNIVMYFDYKKIIEQKEDFSIEAKISIENLSSGRMTKLKFGCVSNEENYTNWKGLDGIFFKVDLNNNQLEENETQEVIFKKRIRDKIFPGILFYPLYIKNERDLAVMNSLRILEIHFIIYGDEYL
jgi:hypothetical protein